MRPPDLNATFCPACGRWISTNRGKFRRHADDTILRECPMSGDSTPGSERAAAMITAARTALNLAHQVRDEDTGWVWRYLADLTNRDPMQLCTLAFVALCAIPSGQTLEEAFAWVLALPSASEVTV
jgi:hypothetical protein